MKKYITRNRKRKLGKKNRSLLQSGILSSKADAQFLIKLLGKTFYPNKATIEARKMNQSISRLTEK